MQSVVTAKGSATIPVPTTQTAGTYTVAISYSGDVNYAGTNPVNVTLTVSPATQTITFPNPGAQTYGVAPIT